MVFKKEVFSEFNDVLSWLEEKNLGDPAATHYIKKHNLDIVAEAFNIPANFVAYLIENKEINVFTKEEKNIIEFYFKLFRKQMN